jgi:hypothetical protein
MKLSKSLNLKRMFGVGLLAAGLLALPFSAPAAEEEKPTGDVTVSVLSQNFWRGYEMSRNSIVIQPSMTIGYKGFSANFWGNLDTRPYSPANASYGSTWNETDFTLAYTTTAGPFNIGGGYIYYSLASLNKDLPDRDDSQDLFVSLGLNTPLSPTLTVYKEIDHYHNWYFLLGISHVFELSQRVSLKLAASAGYLLSTDETRYPKYDSAYQPDGKFSNFHDGLISASLPVKVTDRITVTPVLSYVFPLSGEARDEMKVASFKGTASPAERDASFVYGGLSVSFSF